MSREVIIFVEGISDKLGLQSLLSNLIQEKQEQGITIAFFEAPVGNKKKSLLTKVPKKAVNIILNKPNSIVVAMPDLFPKNIGFHHETEKELIKGIYDQFEQALEHKCRAIDWRLMKRFKVFCFKYDFECLLLAADEILKTHFRTRSFQQSWIQPVEDQNHGRPPKRIIEEIFDHFNQKYVPTIDAPLLLSQASYSELAGRCPQCFKPFTIFLENL